jgi:hypothetical protein
MLFTRSDVGCWVDGAFGEDHRRDKLSVLLESIGTPNALNLATELLEPAPDDYSDEDDALELLQENTEEGLIWMMEAGNILLIVADDYTS